MLWRRAIVLYSLLRFKNETQGRNVKHPLDIADLVSEACETVMAGGKVDWCDIQAAIKLKLAGLPAVEREYAENQLKLMISREEDQGHKVVSH
jgi:hypothetical protein